MVGLFKNEQISDVYKNKWALFAKLIFWVNNQLDNCESILLQNNKTINLNLKINLECIFYNSCFSSKFTNVQMKNMQINISKSNLVFESLFLVLYDF